MPIVYVSIISLLSKQKGDAIADTDAKKTNVVWRLFGDSFLADLFGIFMPGVVAIGATVLIGVFLI